MQHTTKKERENSMNSRSCTHYIQATAAIHFPENNVSCEFCPLMDSDICKRKYCKLTGEYLADTRTIGYECPLKIKEEENT